MKFMQAEVLFMSALHGAAGEALDVEPLQEEIEDDGGGDETEGPEEILPG